MIEIVYVMLFAMILLFLYNTYLLFFSKQKKEGDTKAVIDSWKKSLFVFIIALLVFFIYFGTTFNTIQQTQTINLNDGSPAITYTNNAYLDAITFFPLMNALIWGNFFLLVAQVLKEFRTFGQTKFSRRGSRFKH